MSKQMRFLLFYAYHLNIVLPCKISRSETTWEIENSRNVPAIIVSQTSGRNDEILLQTPVGGQNFHC